MRPAARVLAKLRTRTRSSGRKSLTPARCIAWLTPTSFSAAFAGGRAVRRAGGEPARSVATLGNDFQKLAALELEFYAQSTAAGCRCLQHGQLGGVARAVSGCAPCCRQRSASRRSITSPRAPASASPGASFAILLGEEIPQRRKMGFTFPWQLWLRHELKNTITHTLGDKQLYEPLSLDPAYGRQLLQGLERAETACSRGRKCGHSSSC